MCQCIYPIPSYRVPTCSPVAEGVSRVEGQRGWTYHCRHLSRLTSAMRISVVCALFVCGDARYLCRAYGVRRGGSVGW